MLVECAHYRPNGILPAQPRAPQTPKGPKRHGPRGNTTRTSSPRSAATPSFSRPPRPEWSHPRLLLGYPLPRPLLHLAGIQWTHRTRINTLGQDNPPASYTSYRVPPRDPHRPPIPPAHQQDRWTIQWTRRGTRSHHTTRLNMRSVNNRSVLNVSVRSRIPPAPLDPRPLTPVCPPRDQSPPLHSLRQRHL